MLHLTLRPQAAFFRGFTNRQPDCLGFAYGLISAQRVKRDGFRHVHSRSLSRLYSINENFSSHN
jgi:hypothetical protein